MACKLVSKLESKPHIEIYHSLLFNEIPEYNMTPIDLAVEVRSLKFIALPAIQNLIDKIWKGDDLMNKSFDAKEAITSVRLVE